MTEPCRDVPERREGGVTVPSIHPKTWEDGVMPLDEFPPEWRERIDAAVYQRDDYQCLHCGTDESLSLDHIHPWSLGGEDTLENLQTLCRPCNSRKGARLSCGSE